MSYPYAWPSTGYGWRPGGRRSQAPVPDTAFGCVSCHQGVLGADMSDRGRYFGSMSPATPWALPPYMRYEPRAGLDGYEGFGDAASDLATAIANKVFSGFPGWIQALVPIDTLAGVLRPKLVGIATNATAMEILNKLGTVKIAGVDVTSYLRQAVIDVQAAQALFNIPIQAQQNLERDLSQLPQQFPTITVQAKVAPVDVNLAKITVPAISVTKAIDSIPATTSSVGSSSTNWLLIGGLAAAAILAYKFMK